MPFIELFCDQPGCTHKERVLKTAADIVEARRVIRAGEVLCPVHGVREDPLLVGRDPRPRA